MNNFNEQKYLPVKSIVSDELSRTMTQYALIEEMTNYSLEINRDGAQVENSHSVYSDSLTETILLNLKNTIENITNLELIPTYSYYRVYRPGNYLRPHFDRESCEISCSICFGFNYLDQNDTIKWPLFFNDTPIILDPKDAVVYKGMEIEHSRKKLISPEGSYHVQGFFHYVDANGPYTKYAMDNRQFIGEKIKKNPYNKSYLSTIL